MPADPNPSTNPPLSVRLRQDWLAAILRADGVRFDTLVSLGTAWGDDQGREELIAHLDSLAEAMRSPREGELDHLVEAIEGAAGMDDAEVEIDLYAARRLHAELGAVLDRLGRFNPAGTRGAQEIRHPAFAPTREHFAARPLPEQARRSA